MKRSWHRNIQEPKRAIIVMLRPLHPSGKKTRNKGYFLVERTSGGTFFSSPFQSELTSYFYWAVPQALVIQVLKTSKGEASHSPCF